MVGAFKKEPDKPYSPVTSPETLPDKTKEEPRKVITERKGLGGMIESRIPHLPALNFKFGGYWEKEVKKTED